MALFFSIGKFKYDNKVKMPLETHTEKTLEKSLKIVMISDLHLGYNITRREFSNWVDMINSENPDLILIGGDILDGNIRPVEEEKTYEEFRRFKAPVYACLGNHEFYTGISESFDFYKKAGINLLADSVATVKGINIIGRDDWTNQGRKSLSEIVGSADLSKFTVLLDHQPYNLEEAEHAGIDFQFSGHTHYGQCWPLSWFERLIYEDAYGYHRRGRTEYYVSSGIGIWGCKFRIGTRSEYIVLTVEN